MFDSAQLLKIANMPMPFGKYSGRPLIRLPEEYLLWMRDKGFPRGELGELLALTLEIKIAGADEVIRPLMKNTPDQQ